MGNNTTSNFVLIMYELVEYKTKNPHEQQSKEVNIFSLKCRGVGGKGGGEKERWEEEGRRKTEG